MDAILFDLDSNITTPIPKLGSISELARDVGINESGTVVGQSGDKGFLFTSDMGIVDLTASLNSNFAGWDIISANDINNNGWIIGTGRFNGGSDHAVILKPLKTPGDFDGDGDVDGRDFLAWQRNPELGDLADWLSAYGSNSLQAANSAAVPEPNTCLLTLLAASLALAVGRGRR